MALIISTSQNLYNFAIYAGTFYSQVTLNVQVGVIMLYVLIVLMILPSNQWRRSNMKSKNSKTSIFFSCLMLHSSRSSRIMKMTSI